MRILVGAGCVRSAAEAAAEDIIMFEAAMLDCMAAMFWADGAVCALTIKGDTRRAATMRWRMQFSPIGQECPSPIYFAQHTIVKEKISELVTYTFFNNLVPPLQG